MLGQVGIGIPSGLTTMDEYRKLRRMYPQLMIHLMR